MDVVNYLQILCSNEVDVPIGGIVHTGMQNERGGYENDCMLVRTSEKRYILLCKSFLYAYSHDLFPAILWYHQLVSKHGFTNG